MRHALPMPVRTRVLDSARSRARVARAEAGTEIRRARMASGLRLKDVSAAVGRSVSWLSRVERGRMRAISVEDLVVVAAAAGVKIWIGTYPGQRAIFDAPQLTLLRRFRERVGEGWEWSFEVVLPAAGDQRAADAVIRNDSATVMIEAFTRLADAQAQLRAVSVKARDLGVGRVVVVVAATGANRRAMGAAGHVLAAEFPLGSRSTMRALRGGRDPGANGLVLV